MVIRAVVAERAERVVPKELGMQDSGCKNFTSYTKNEVENASGCKTGHASCTTMSSRGGWLLQAVFLESHESDTIPSLELYPISRGAFF
jgi:hypothetical protein